MLSITATIFNVYVPNGFELSMASFSFGVSSFDSISQVNPETPAGVPGTIGNEELWSCVSVCDSVHLLACWFVFFFIQDIYSIRGHQCRFSEGRGFWRLYWLTQGYFWSSGGEGGAPDYAAEFVGEIHEWSHEHLQHDCNHPSHGLSSLLLTSEGGQGWAPVGQISHEKMVSNTMTKRKEPLHDEL